MRRYAVHRYPQRSAGMVVDVQGASLVDLSTRVVIPLVDADGVAHRFDGLHPIVSVIGRKYVLATHLLTAVPSARLGEPVGSLAAQDYLIGRALDRLLFDL